jgi:neurofibromin 1
LLNIWRARWLSLVTATAFQVSPVVQTRSFVALGGLATSDIDEDFMYQILAAMSKACDSFHDNSSITVVSMLRCVCKLMPALNDHRRYVPAFFWLGVALLEHGHPAFFAEASSLIQVSLETMEKKGLFRNRAVSTVLLEARQPFEDATLQMDDMLGISFDTEFSISLAHVLFKGIRHSILKESAEDVLRTLLRISVKSHHQLHGEGASNGIHSILPVDSLGYFLALLSVSSSTTSYQRLLKEAGIEDAWHAEAGLPDLDRDGGCAPKVTPVFLGINDFNTALMVATFIGTMLGSAQGDDAETEMLYGLLAELALSFPDVISLV